MLYTEKKSKKVNEYWGIIPKNLISYKGVKEIEFHADYTDYRRATRMYSEGW